MFLLAQSEPTGLTDVLWLPALLVAIGLGLWYGGLHFENRTEKSWMKWCAFIPIAIALVLGFQMPSQAMDYTYQQLMPNKKTVYGHYMALAMPLGALVAIIGWHLYLKKTGAYEHRF
jgi:hypothetical protein